MLQNLLLEKLLKEYDYLASDLKYKKAVIDEYLPSLHKSQNVEISENDLQESIHIKRIPSEIEKKIYHQISKLTHPDKNNSENDNFIDASTAYSAGNFLQLIKIARKLEINLQIDTETLNRIEEEIKELKLQNSILDQHLIWKWYLTTDAVEKEMLEQHIKSL